MRQAEVVVEYCMEGSGPTVLVLHGSPGGYDQGRAAVHLLAQSGFTFLSLSRPGYRRTPVSSGQPEAQAELLAATLDALNASQVVVLALSGGGPTALLFALRFPQRCRRLLMVCALTSTYTEVEVYRSLPTGQRVQKWLFNHLLDYDSVLYLLAMLSARMPREARSQAFIESPVMNPQHSSGYRNDMQQFATFPVHPFQNIRVPTLIVHGTADVDVPFWQAEALAHALPNARLVAVAGAHHLSTLAGEHALEGIRQFLQERPADEDLHTGGEKAQEEE